MNCHYKIKTRSYLMLQSHYLKIKFIDFPLKFGARIQSIIIQIQWCAIEMQHLLHKPYVNEVTMTGHNLSLKCLQSLGQRLSQQMRFRSFKRGTVSLCRSKGCKNTSCQNQRSEKNLALRPGLEPGLPLFGSTPAAQQDFFQISNFDSL